ncbi:MAG: HAMP domain-containing histidine kinase [Oscillospiraceae bacterium]|nr:HAMP domain-containing histidine kinase [Oscillospiraceae bacterium]
MGKKGTMRSRWMFRTVAAVSAVLILALTLFTVFVSNYHYSLVRARLTAKAKTARGIFAGYVSASSTEFYDTAYRYTINFDEDEKMVLQVVATDGCVILSTDESDAGTNPETGDIARALETGQMANYTGRDASGNRIIAVSAPIQYSNGELAGIIRYVSSASQVDRQVLKAFLIALGVAALILLVVVLLNLVFIRSVIEPISEMTKMSKRMAAGSYGMQIEKTYDNEIGEMVASINEMSFKIAQSEKMQTEFISSVSHELRTPLTAITGWSETLLYDDTMSGDARKGLSIILREARRLTKMVEELLEFTRIEDGRFTLNVEQIDICAELEDTMFTYRELLQQDDMELIYQSPEEDVPLIPGDPGRLRQVFLNILDNSAKYAREGKQIEVSVKMDGSYVSIQIRDHGPGIPEADLENVKMKFFKGSNAKERGSGIGLAVCDEIIRYHGGSLVLENAEGGGLLTSIRLPVSASTGAE